MYGTKKNPRRRSTLAVEVSPPKARRRRKKKKRTPRRRRKNPTIVPARRVPAAARSAARSTPRRYRRNPKKTRRYTYTRRRNPEEVTATSWIKPAIAAGLGYVVPGIIWKVIGGSARNKMRGWFKTNGDSKARTIISAGSTALMFALTSWSKMLQKYQKSIMIGSGLRLTVDASGMLSTTPGSFGETLRMVVGLPTAGSYANMLTGTPWPANTPPPAGTKIDPKTGRLAPVSFEEDDVGDQYPYYDPSSGQMVYPGQQPGQQPGTIEAGYPGGYPDPYGGQGYPPAYPGNGGMMPPAQPGNGGMMPPAQPGNGGMPDGSVMAGYMYRQLDAPGAQPAANLAGYMYRQLDAGPQQPAAMGAYYRRTLYPSRVYPPRSMAR